MKSLPTHEKLFAVGTKGDPNATFSLFFLGVGCVGLGLGWGVRRFHNNIYMFSSPTEFGALQTPYWFQHFNGEGYASWGTESGVTHRLGLLFHGLVGTHHTVVGGHHSSLLLTRAAG